MKIRKLEWKNFQSYGDWQCIELPEDGAAMYLVSGANGAGKSSIADALRFGLYGKVPGKQQRDISNRHVEGGAAVRVSLVTRGHEVVIERTLEPSRVRLTVDGEAYKKANKGPSDYFVDELLEIPFEVFNNVISLSVNDFKSFITLGAEDKRKIVDRLFGFAVINRMREITRAKLKEASDGLTASMAALDAANRAANQSAAELAALEQRMAQAAQGDERAAREDLEKYTALLDFHRARVADAQAAVRAAQAASKTVSASMYEARAAGGEAAKRMRLYDSGLCPTCGSDLKTDAARATYDALALAKAEADARCVEAESRLRELGLAEAQAAAESSSLADKGQKIDARIADARRRISAAESKDSVQAESMRSLLARIREDCAAHAAARAARELQKSWEQTLDEALGEKGIKQLAVRTILPALNAEVRSMIDEMHLGYELVFDERFDASLTQLGVPVEYGSLSTGEKKRVDFVVLVAVLKMMLTRFPGANMLFLDEVFASVDPGGVQTILRIIRGCVRELRVNTFVMTPDPRYAGEQFDFMVQVTKSPPGPFGVSSIEVRQLK